jgi:hypothetical protein
MACMPVSRPSGSTTESPTYLKFYAGEMAWREDMRRDDNGAQYQRAGINALGHPKSRNRCVYWQRHAAL